MATDRKGSRWPASRWLLSLALYLPLAIQCWRYSDERIYYGELVHWSGDWATWILLFTLAITPLKRLLGQRWPSAWLLRRRRDLGISCFVYAAVHTGVYLARKADVAAVFNESLEWGMATGWLALLLFLPLFLTSNDAAVRALRRNWKRVHWLVYPAALLVIVHWYGTAFSPTPAYWNAAILLLLMGARLIPRSPK